jgi:succinate dehydrogenase/fumarate reductase flavoprotein subunit
MAACSAAPDRETLLLTDRALGACSSAMAQGGLQLPFPTDASRERLVEDMVRSARVALDRDLVAHFVDEIAGCVDELEHWGLELDRDDTGALVRRTAGGLSEPRIVSAGDAIGPALMRVLLARARSVPLAIEAHARVARIEPTDDGFVLHVRDGDRDARPVRAATVVVATGGLTYRVAQSRHERTTNPRNENHVLYDALCEMGLPRTQDDLFQYQPFGIVGIDTGSIGRCVPESIVNLPVRLLDRHGNRVCDLRRDRLDVATAMRDAMRNGDAYSVGDGGHGLRLTLADVDPAEMTERFPRLTALLERNRALGDDVLVRPFLHYQLGGLAAPLDGTTVVPGMFVAGEMVGGLHGKNRLMGNGITDSLVRGRLAGRAAVSYAGAREPRVTP